MKLDTTQSWQRAHGAVIANLDAIMALAGVFFLLPALVLDLLAPQSMPTITANMTPDAMASALESLWLKLAPYALPVLAMNTLGTLTLVALLGTAARLTVAQAIIRALRGLLPYVAAQLAFGLMFSLVGGLVVSALALGGARMQGLAVVVVIAGMLYAVVRLTLVAPVMLAEGVRNPLQALAKSWRMSAGNVAAMGLFMALMFVVLLVVRMAGVGLVGSLAALIGGAEAARITGAVISALAGTVFSVYFAALITRFHAQLAETSPAPRHVW